MGIVAGLSAAASAASLGSTISGAFSGPSGGGGSAPGGQGYYGGTSAPPSYIPTAQPQADQLYQQGYNQMAPWATDLQNQVLPFYQAYLSNTQNNPNTAGYETGIANAAQRGAGTVAPMQFGGAASLYGAGNSVLNTAMDPQQALYNRTQQQITDQSNAINAMYGLSSSPYGAGVANQNLNNFNIDWQNAQLARQAQGVQSAGQAFSGASDLGGAGVNTLATSAQLPYSAYQGILGDQLNAANAQTSGYTNAFGLDQNMLNALSAYLKLGQSATSVGQAGSNQNFGQQQTLGTQLGQNISGAANSLSGLFGPSGSAGSSGGLFSGLFGPTTFTGQAVSDINAPAYQDALNSSFGSYGL